MVDTPPPPAGCLTRDVIKLSGEDTSSLLQGLLTCNVEDLAPGMMRHGALLTPQGKIIDTMMLSQGADALYLDVATGRGEGLRKKLMLYRLRAKVDIADATTDLTVGVGEAPEAAFMSAADPRLDALGPRWLSPAAETDALPNVDGQFALHERSHGVPAFGDAFGETDVFPLDVNLDALHGIDHKKGCFVGQEVASRMFRKGEIRKRTWIVVGDGLEKDASLTIDGTTVGTVLCSDGQNALAMVRLDRLKAKDGLPVTGPDGRPATLHEPEYLNR